MNRRYTIYILGCAILLFGWSNGAGAVDSFQELSNDIQLQSANTQEGLKNYQQCYDISRQWWKLHEPELALDFLYESARQAELVLPAKLAAAKLLELAELATREYRDRYTAEDMLQKARERMKYILDYYEWRVPYHEANRIEKEAAQLKYLPRGKYIPRQVVVPVPGNSKILAADDFVNNELGIKGFIGDEIRYKSQPSGGMDITPNSKPPLPEPKRPKEPPSKPDKPPKPPNPPDKPPKPPEPPDKPPKPPKPPDKPPLPPDRPKPPLPPEPPSSDTVKYK